MSEFTIRAVEEQDFSAWRPLWDGYVNFYRGDLPEIVTETTWQRLLKRSANPHGIVAVDTQGNMVGIAHFIFHSSTWSTTSYCYLEDLYVCGEARGGGVGKLLIEAVTERAKAHGSERLYWQTQEYNGAARSLYDTLADRNSFVIYDKRGM